MYLGFDAKYEYIPEHNSHAIIGIFANPSISGRHEREHSAFVQVAYKRR
jgi:hypothetical protein